MIKFRAWHKLSKTMHIVTCMEFFVPHGDLDSICIYDNDKNVDVVITVPEDNLELMQWSGLYDSKGIEIYDGDIIDMYDTTELEDFLYRRVYHSSIGINIDKYEPWVGNPSLFGIVRGNVYQNIDLLNNTRDVEKE